MGGYCLGSFFVELIASPGLVAFALALPASAALNAAVTGAVVTWTSASAVDVVCRCLLDRVPGSIVAGSTRQVGPVAVLEGMGCCGTAEVAQQSHRRRPNPQTWGMDVSKVVVLVICRLEASAAQTEGSPVQVIEPHRCRVRTAIVADPTTRLDELPEDAEGALAEKLETPEFLLLIAEVSDVALHHLKGRVEVDRALGIHPPGMDGPLVDHALGEGDPTVDCRAARREVCGLILRLLAMRTPLLHPQLPVLEIRLQVTRAEHLALEVDRSVAIRCPRPVEAIPWGPRRCSRRKQTNVEDIFRVDIDVQCAEKVPEGRCGSSRVRVVHCVRCVPTRKVDG